MGNRAHYVININTCAVSVRTAASDEMPTIMRLLSDDLAKDVIVGKVKAEDVVEAITKADMTAEGFSWREYEARRKADEERLNVCDKNLVPVADEENAESEDRNVVSFDSLGLGAGGKPDEKPKGKADEKPKGKAGGEDPKSGGAAASDLDGIFGK